MTREEYYLAVPPWCKVPAKYHEQVLLWCWSITARLLQKYNSTDICFCLGCEYCNSAKRYKGDKR